MSSNPNSVSATGFGVQDDTGEFQRKKLQQIERDIVQRARQELDEDVELSQGSPIKQLFDVVVLESERFWKVLEDVYYSAYYEDAYGKQLDRLLSLAMLERIPRRVATGEVVFGVNGAANDFDVTIPRGTRVSTEPTDDKPAIPFITTDAAVLEAGASQTDLVPVRAAEPWECDLSADWLGSETNVAANTITNFINPIDGVDTVTNPHPTGAYSFEEDYDYQRGRDRETDAEFRNRYEETLGENAAATLDAIRANVKNDPGVDAAFIEENVTMEDRTDEGGLPPKSFRLTVLGGFRNDIAQRIVESRPAGISSHGDIEGKAYTDDGEERTEYFDRATEIPVYVDVSVTTNQNFPDDGTKRIESAIIEYVGGTTADQTEHEGATMGEDIVYDLVYQAAMSVQGVFRAEVYMDTDEDDGITSTADISVGKKEFARTSPGRINVTSFEADIQ